MVRIVSAFGASRCVLGGGFGPLDGKVSLVLFGSIMYVMVCICLLSRCFICSQCSLVLERFIGRL